MTRLRGLWPTVLLTALGTIFGLMLLEAGARAVAVRADRREGRLDRDLAGLGGPHPGSTVTLGQIIRRSDNPRIVYELRPRLDVIFSGGHVTTSDAGYRGVDAEVPKPAGTFRIVGIGDSYMFGQGVSDDETYLASLPDLLRASFSARHIETINLAVPGFNTVMEVETLLTSGVGLEPDLILIEIVGNDLDLPNFLWTAIDPWTLNRSFLLDFVLGRLSRNADAEASGFGLAEAPGTTGSSGETFSRDPRRVPVQYASMVGLDAFRNALARLAGFARSHKIPVLAVTHGVWFEDAMMSALETNGVPVLVLRSALRQKARALGDPDYARSPLALSPSDLHPSPMGHLVIAEELSLWIPRSLPPG